MIQKGPFFIFFLIALLTMGACNGNRPKERGMNGAFAKPQGKEQTHIDRIVNSGELIIATISGPDTYFDYQGVSMGVQYALAEDFANTLGVAVRVEIANDTMSLVKKLNDGDADLIALQLPEKFCRENGLEAAGAHDKKAHTTWAVRKGADDLAESLDDWYGEETELNVEKKEKQRFGQRHTVRRKIRAPFISKEKSIISTYDTYFKEAARFTGWDWRLIAAQCYQESGFDPNAVSWAGAKGLMQIMPATATQLGLAQTDVFKPAENIAAATKYLRKLQDVYAGIPDPEERVKFVLAAYNGGAGHIKDARTLTRKYGGNPDSWADVSYFVRNLSNAKYYRDPAVKHGYMIGAETANYVESIMQRWRLYGGDVRNISKNREGNFNFNAPASAPAGTDGKRPHKKNRFSQERKILSPEEMQQNR